MSELEELFGGAVVSYEDREELKRLVDWYLSHDDERHEKASKGRAIVLAKHTFRHRAQELDRLVRQLRRRGQQ
jgi:spore maturation protein CgeB